MAPDVLDDLLDFDTNNNDIFRDVDISMDLPSRGKSSLQSENSKDVSGLGIDEEIQVQKKRKPVVRLDEHRLLSPSGIPKLRHLTQKQLRFKGKGHEFSDIARLLNTYQLWLDALYPRAKFADGLAIIEKLGHTKKMQLLRRDWINESKVQVRKNETSDHGQKAAAAVEELESELRHRPSTASKEHEEVHYSHGSNPTAVESTSHGDPNSIRSSTADPTSNWPTNQDPNEGLFFSENEGGGDQMSEVELDDLGIIEDIIDDPRTRKSDFGVVSQISSSVAAIERSGAEFEDEMEAMASMGDL